MVEQTEGFSFLFSKLCELSFNSESCKGWDIYRRPRFTDQRRGALKRCLYETLFGELKAPWIGNRLRFREHNGNKIKAGFPFDVLNKFSIAAFQFRVAGRFDDADRLDHYVNQWRNLPEPSSSVVNFNSPVAGNVVGCEAVLRFLIELAGSGGDTLICVLGHQNEPWVKKQKKVKKMPLLEGPLVVTNFQLLHCQPLDFKHYVHYGSELFESVPILSIPGQGISEVDQNGLEIFQAAPGSFSGKAKFFASKTTGEDLHERESRTSLFNALVHSQTTDLQVKLSMPDLHNGSKPFHSLAIEQREFTDDEGFESLETSSNSSTCSDQVTSSKESQDVWSIALGLPDQTFFTWETAGRRDLLDERPYLTEAGPAVFDEVYNTMIHRVSYLMKSSMVNFRMVPLSVLIKDSINVLIGVPSGTFHLDKVSQSFRVTDRVRTTGVSPETLQSILSKLAAIGADYIQLNRFANHQRGQTAGKVLRSFLRALQNYLQCYRTTVLSLEVSSVRSPFQLSVAFDDLGRQLRFLSNVCLCSQAFNKAPCDPKVKFPTGVKLLTYLYQLCLEHSTSKFYPILLSLLKHSTMPYIMFVQTWIFKGVYHDVFGEFMIEIDEQYLEFRDKNFWTHGFAMVGKDKLDCVPLFLGELADDIFVCGKTINLLRLCCPEHYLCDPGIPVPKMEVTFSFRRLGRIEEECKQYMAEINKMHMQRQEQRENERAAAEEEKQHAIFEEREKAEKGLAEITALIQKAKDAVEQKKRGDFAFLKEQMEKAFQHKSMVKEQEKEAEIQLIKEMMEREVTTASVEEEITKKAREDLIKYYEELSREVEHREAQAQWIIRRRLLDTTRAQFLVQEQARLDSLREQILRSSRAEKIDEPKESSDKKHEGVGARPDVSDAEREVSTVVSAPSPSLVSLIASGVKTDAMLRAESRSIVNGSSRSIDETGVTDSSGGCRSIAVDGMPSATSSEPSFIEAAPENNSRKTWDNPQQSIAQLQKLKEEGSGRKTWDTPQDGELTITSPTPKNHPSDSSIQFAMYGDKQRGNESDHATELSAAKDGSGAKIWHPSHSSLEDILYPNTPEGRSKLETQTLSSVAQSPGSVTQLSHLDLEGLVTTQPSSPVIKESLATTGPRTSSSLGHPSDSSAQHLLCSDSTQVGATVTPESRSLEHGHPSDSSLSDHFLYPTNVDRLIPGDRVDPYDHPSDSKVAFSGDSLNVAQVLLHKSRPTWQHPSDASVQKLLSDISILEDSQKTTRGIPPPSQAQNVLYPGLEASSSAAISQTRGTPPLSVAQDIMYPSVGGSTQIPTARQSRGTPPPSVIQDIMYPTGETAVAPKVSSRGHEPAVKITKIMYYLRDKKDETESLVVRPKPLEFEDVWSASQVEPLRDKFDVLDERPLSNLLGSAMSELPFTGGSNDDDDTDAAQMMSLPVLLQKCVMGPLYAQISLVNSAITSYFVEDLQIIKHLDVFKKFLFLEDGEFSLSLSNQLFDKLAAGVSPRELCSVPVMNSIVSKALQLSVYSDTSELAQKLAFALRSLPDIFKANEIGTLDFLELRYKVDWPLNIVITEKSVVKYNKIFSFMLRLKRLSWVLRDIWLHLKHVAYFSKSAGSPQIRQLQLFRHEMQHFVHNLEGYLSNQILNVTWCEFHEALLRVNGLDDLHNQHAEYLRKAIFRSLLSRKASPVMAIISDLCTLILKLRTQLLASPWQQDPTLGHVTHPAFDVMSKTHKAFKEYSGFLLTVVGKLVRRGYQSHLDDFLLRINFNNFYNVEYTAERTSSGIK